TLPNRRRSRRQMAAGARQVAAGSRSGPPVGSPPGLAVGSPTGSSGVRPRFAGRSPAPPAPAPHAPDSRADAAPVRRPRRTSGLRMIAAMSPPAAAPHARAEPEHGERLAEALAALLAVEPELPYANFAPIAARPGAAAELHRARWLADGGEVLVARTPGGEPLASLRLEPRPFESAHFGLPMARLEQPIAHADPDRREAGLRAALDVALARARERGFRHVAARASTRD